MWKCDVNVLEDVKDAATALRYVMRPGAQVHRFSRRLSLHTSAAHPLQIKAKSEPGPAKLLRS